MADDGWGPPVEVAQADTGGGWGPPAGAPAVSPAAPDKPMPGYLEALGQGLASGATDIAQSGQIVTGETPQYEQETSPAAQPYEWRDLYEPSRGIKKTAYGLGKSSPTLATALAGGALGTAIEPGGGTLVGGVAGAAVGSAFQTVGPAFAQELKKTPQDPDGAWDRAVKMSLISGAASGGAVAGD